MGAVPTLLRRRVIKRARLGTLTALCMAHRRWCRNLPSASPRL